MRRNQIRSFGGMVCIFLISLLLSSSTNAQEPACPPGFEWRRMSGVGCVQTNCPEIANAKYSYTQDCICQDGYSGCFEPVDYAGFDQSSCGPNCPFSELIACVSPDATCPNVTPAPDLTAEPEITILPTEPSGFDQDGDNGGQSSDSGSDDSSQQEDQGNFLTGDNPHPASNAQEAVGAISATALLAAWILTQLLSGGDLQEILSGLFGSGSKPPQTSSAAQASALPNIPGSSQPGTPPPGTPGTQTPPLQSSGVTPPTVLTPPGQPPSAPVQPPAQAPAQQPPSSQTQQAASPLITDPSQYHQAITDKFNQILQDKVKDKYYVRNPDFLSKIWNNFPISSSLIEGVRGLKGGQCGEFADWGQQWIKPWAEQTFGPGVIVDSIWVGESSSRYPEGFLGAADALYQANHTATRVTLPNGDSYVVDFWDGMIKQRSGDPDQIKNIEVVKESEWINKWRDQIETSGDPADICNVNRYQDDLRRHIASYDAKHPSAAAALSPDRYQENNEIVDRAIQDWLKNSNYPPEIKQTVVQNWREHGGTWGMYRPDPPLDPASAVADSFFQMIE